MAGCFGSEGNLLVSETWDSQEKLDAFGARLMPILVDVGIGFDQNPEIFEVNEVIRRFGGVGPDFDDE